MKIISRRILSLVIALCLMVSSIPIFIQETSAYSPTPTAATNQTSAVNSLGTATFPYAAYATFTHYSYDDEATVLLELYGSQYNLLVVYNASGTWMGWNVTVGNNAKAVRINPPVSGFREYRIYLYSQTTPIGSSWYNLRVINRWIAGSYTTPMQNYGIGTAYGDTFSSPVAINLNNSNIPNGAEISQIKITGQCYTANPINTTHLQASRDATNYFTSTAFSNGTFNASIGLGAWYDVKTTWYFRTATTMGSSSNGLSVNSFYVTVDYWYDLAWANYGI